MKSKKRVKKFAEIFLMAFLLCFMLFIFGPSEIFFANVTEFSFLYQEFIGWMVLMALAFSTIMAFVVMILPDKISGIVSGVLFSLSLGGYLQVMFLNRKLDLLGQNPNGYSAETAQAIWNILIWVVLMGIVVAFMVWKKEIATKVVLYCSAFLLCIQGVALFSLVLNAKGSAYEREEGALYLSGEDQFVVSADKNVIVFVLDYFSNQYLQPIQEKYPEATECMHDFTYYSNTDCTYFGTFASLPHILTGCHEDANTLVNEWCKQIWESDTATDFYQLLHDKNYKVNIYTPEKEILCGLNGIDILQDKFSNVTNVTKEVNVNTPLLLKTLSKMSAYRMFPEVLKPCVYTNMGEYANIVTFKTTGMAHENWAFKERLQAEGLSKDDSSNYFIMQHLMGEHQYTTDEFGNYKENATLEETGEGCMVILNEYFDKLKELGVYDSSTIIVTSDHGGPYDPQVIFFIKEPEETHEKLITTNAPISHCEFIPTIVKAIDGDALSYGATIYDFTENESRERTYWLRIQDDNYPSVPCYTGDKEGASNVHYGYTYTGDFTDLQKQIQEGPTQILPAVDTFF